jgi:hypothetical protein
MERRIAQTSHPNPENGRLALLSGRFQRSFEGGHHLFPVPVAERLRKRPQAQSVEPEALPPSMG